MKIANTYNHLNAEEFLLCRQEQLYNEIKQCIKSIDANLCLKISSAKGTIGRIFYDQKKLNSMFKENLNASGWKSKTVDYYVTGNESLSREIVSITNKDEQRKRITDKGLTPYKTKNEVDYQKKRVAIEIQFGKYFSVAYDLHVKHTFFYMRNDIDVGIEIIPTIALEEHMDSGVAWFENEVTNVIREGRTNPMVPILIIGIEPDNILSSDPCECTNQQLDLAINNSDITKFNNNANKLEKEHKLRKTDLERIQKIKERICTKN